MSAIEQRARELLARMEKAKRKERGHWCDARAAVDSGCEILPQLIAALTPPDGFVLVEKKHLDSLVAGHDGSERARLAALAVTLAETP